MGEVMSFGMSVYRVAGSCGLHSQDAGAGVLLNRLSGLVERQLRRQCLCMSPASASLSAAMRKVTSLSLGRDLGRRVEHRHAFRKLPQRDGRLASERLDSA